MRRTSRPKHELSTILRQHREQLPELINNTWKRRCLYALSRCRTPEMGGHIDQCNHAACGHVHMSYNSCRNRHCPKCQGHLKEKWIIQRTQELLKCPYYHVVFTLPSELHELALIQPKEVYGSLFAASWKVIKGFGENPKFLGAKTGMISVLHTWGQNLSLHPHLHCIVPSGGLSASGKWKNTRSKGKYLYPAQAMAEVFRASFMQELRKHIEVPQSVARKCFEKQWVVYCKQPFWGPKQVIEYLGRYTHKVAISNHRILDLSENFVRFAAKDYKHGGRQIVVTMNHPEFIRRFALHILPKGFTRIRHYGILSSSSKQKSRVTIEKQIGAVFTSQKVVEKPLHRVCPVCKKGRLETVLVFDNRGPPKHWVNRLRMKVKK
jgi:predicted glycoside hydrolase/deacetylase ChbG (UPF0249 family)